MGRKKSWPPKETVSLRFEQETINYIQHLKKYLSNSRSFFSTRKITNSVVVEQAVGHYFKVKRSEYYNKTQGKSFK
jgi:hypothetical protein